MREWFCAEDERQTGVESLLQEEGLRSLRTGARHPLFLSGCGVPGDDSTI
jgi:hypothetical protein